MKYLIPLSFAAPLAWAFSAETVLLSALALVSIAVAVVSGTLALACIADMR